MDSDSDEKTKLLDKSKTDGPNLSAYFNAGHENDDEISFHRSEQESVRYTELDGGK